MENCPCGSTKNYALCCETFITGKAIPATPEELMRSRYSAYAKAEINYIADTMIGPAAADFNKEHALQSAPHIKWLGLKIIQSDFNDSRGTVEFIAQYSLLSNKETVYEISEFHKENNRWFYYDGATPKVGRNDACPCGSGKKFKKCCGN